MTSEYKWYFLMLAVVAAGENCGGLGTGGGRRHWWNRTRSHSACDICGGGGGSVFCRVGVVVEGGGEFPGLHHHLVGRLFISMF